MAAPSTVSEQRTELIARLFPQGVPDLWCPLLTHYETRGAISEKRMIAHLRHLAPHVKGFLIPGSTGDGWDLSEHQTQRVIQIALDQAERLGFFLLIGILKKTTDAAAIAIQQTLERLGARTGESEPFHALQKSRVCGFTVCPPHGKDLSQDEIQQKLAAVLELELPTALYQLPQVTKNEMSPGTIKSLADRFSNFIFFKDTSGNDRVVSSGHDLNGVFRVRGAETDYWKWLGTTRNRYEGFLLSTANCFAADLSQMIRHGKNGKTEPARQLSDRLSSIIIETFQLVSSIKSGNGFANANKAMDHLFAYGSRAVEMAPPLLHDGSVIPVEIIRRTAEILARHDVLPRDGYLDRV